MSIEYDRYLNEHIGNVNKGLHWMLDNLELSQEEQNAVETAMIEFHHDESKYDSEEYDAYDGYFYGGNRSYKVVKDFDYAWLHHIHNNPHHWQYWVLIEDNPSPAAPYKALEIPLNYIFEMIADWWSFSWASGNLYEIFDWYANHKDKQIMHPKSREIVDSILEKIHDILDREKEEVTEYFDDHLEHLDTEDSDEGLYGIPEIKKYPLPDKKHVISAIRFFNYVDPKYEKELASAILEKAEEFGLDLETDISVGNENRFKKYLTGNDDSVEHDGIKGMHWGHRRWQYYDGRFNDEGKRRYFGTKQPGLYDKANSKKDTKKSGYDPNAKSTTSTTATAIGGGGAALSTYDDWEAELYKKMLESGETFDVANMTEEQFKALLNKYGVKTTGDITEMMKKASTGYELYKKHSTGNSSGSDGSKPDSNSVISDQFGKSQSNTKEKKSSSGSGSSGSGSKNSGKETVTTTNQNETTIDSRLNDIMSKAYEAVKKKQEENSEYNTDDIFGDSTDSFLKNLEELTGEKLSDLKVSEVADLKKQMKNHYGEEKWEKTYKENMNDILSKHPEAINSNEDFADVLEEYVGIDRSIMTANKLAEMRKQFKEYYDAHKDDKE